MSKVLGSEVEGTVQEGEPLVEIDGLKNAQVQAEPQAQPVTPDAQPAQPRNGARVRPQNATRENPPAPATTSAMGMAQSAVREGFFHFIDPQHAGGELLGGGQRGAEVLLGLAVVLVVQGAEI